MRSAAKGGAQGWTALLADDSKGVHGKSISPATSPRGRSLLWFTWQVLINAEARVDRVVYELLGAPCVVL